MRAEPALHGVCKQVTGSASRSSKGVPLCEAKMADGMEQLKTTLSQQVEEIDLLQSMYSDECEVLDPTAFRMVRSYVEGAGTGLPNALTVKATLWVESCGDADKEDEEDKREETHSTASRSSYKMELSMRLPHGYPEEHPELHVSSNHLTRHSQDAVNEDLGEYIQENVERGEVCLMQALQWVAECGGQYIPAASHLLPSSSSGGGSHQLEHASKEDAKGSASFSRLWLYMHHIYSKTKRKNILQLAKEYHLSGFCLPGKPGVVCVEGSLRNTTEYYQHLRSWNWKSITCKKREIVENAKDIEALRRVEGFEELAFDAHGHRSNHMDMGQFLKYLEHHKLDYAFKFLFGIDATVQQC